MDSNREIEHEKATAMAVQLVDSLIAAAREEGAEQMVQKIQKAAYSCKPGETIHINNSIPMLVLVSSADNPEDKDIEPKNYR